MGVRGDREGRIWPEEMKERSERITGVCCAPPELTGIGRGHEESRVERERGGKVVGGFLCLFFFPFFSFLQIDVWAAREGEAMAGGELRRGRWRRRSIKFFR